MRWRHRVEEAPVVGHAHDGTRIRADELLEPRDRADVEVVGGLVEQQDVGLRGECLREGHALLPATGERLDARVGEKPEARDHAVDAMPDVPAVLVELALQAIHGGMRGLVVWRVLERDERLVVRPQRLALAPESQRDGFVHGVIAGEGGLLLEQRNARLRCHPALAIVERRGTGQHAEQRRLAGAVAPDEAHVLARLDLELGVIEQRKMAVRETRMGEGEDRHERSRRMNAGECARRAQSARTVQTAARAGGARSGSAARDATAARSGPATPRSFPCSADRTGYRRATHCARSRSTSRQAAAPLFRVLPCQA